MSPLAFLTKILRFCGIDRAVGFTVLSRGWSAMTGFVSLALLVRFMSPLQQGFYSTFASFLGMQVFFELGVGLVISQFASHERAKLEWTPQGMLAGDPTAKARLSSLLHRSMVWYGVIALLVLTMILPAGLIFFHKYEPPTVHIAWQGPWLFVTLTVAMSVVITPLYLLLEGCGLVAEIISAQFVAGILSSLAFWTVLLAHGALFAGPVGGLVSFLWMTGWLWRHKRAFFADLFAAKRPGVSISWRHEMWPFQWKIALSWLSGYFIFQLFVPLLFAFHGPVPAGQMGASMNIAASISGLAIAWVATKAAPFGSLVAKREWARMDRMFFSCLWQSTIVLIVGNVLLWCGMLYLHQHHLGHRLTHRFLSPLPLGLLLLTTPMSHIVGAESIYLRAHKKEPFLVQSLLAGGLIALFCFVLGRPYGVVGMMLGYLIVSIFVGVLMGSWIFMQKRREWHHDIAEAPASLPTQNPLLQ